jgi:hypothetical protein
LLGLNGGRFGRLGMGFASDGQESRDSNKSGAHFLSPSPRREVYGNILSADLC